MKKFAGNWPFTGAKEGQFTPGKALLPARLHMKVLVVASVFAKAPATPFPRNGTNVPLRKLALVCEPPIEPVNAAVMIGRGACPAKPQSAKLFEVWLFKGIPAAA